MLSPNDCPHGQRHSQVKVKGWKTNIIHLEHIYKEDLISLYQIEWT